MKVFDCLLGNINQLDSSFGYEKIVSTVKKHLLKIKCPSLLRFDMPEFFDSTVHQVDPVAKKLMSDLSISKNVEPMQIAGDGSCFFRAISKALYNHENFHVEIRVRCVVELIVKLDEYVRTKNYPSAKDLQFLANVCRAAEHHNNVREILINEALRCSSSNEWASPNMTYVAANAFSINIRQIFSALRQEGIQFQVFNSHVKPFEPSPDHKRK